MDERWATLAVVCMGLGGVVAGLVGVALPEGRRLGALFGLVAGAGVGLVVVGLGSLFDERSEPTAFVFFVASLLGLVTVCAASWIVWRRALGTREPSGELG
jgi:drug/metabolite transporter (DMT)-like permease